MRGIATFHAYDRDRVLFADDVLETALSVGGKVMVVGDDVDV